MSFKSLLRQTVKLYTKSGYNRYGREIVGAGTNYKARVERGTKSKLLPNGEVVNVLATVYLDSSVTINNDDRVTFNSEEYKVFSVKTTVDGQGNTHHLKADLIKWQET
jgi:hypothetical protein